MKKPRSKVVGQRERLDEKDYFIWELRKQGWTYREIAKHEKVQLDHSNICRRIAKFRETLREETKDLAKEHMEVDIARLEDAIKAIYPKVLKGDHSAIDRLVNIIDRKARILGYENLNVSVMSLDDRAILDNLFGAIQKERENKECSLETSPPEQDAQ